MKRGGLAACVGVLVAGVVIFALRAASEGPSPAVAATQPTPEQPDTPQPTPVPSEPTEREGKYSIDHLTPMQHYVTQEAGTEPAFQNEYWDNHRAGKYRCVVCGQVLYTSGSKFDSHCGWPSFTAPVEEGVVTEHVDPSLPWEVRTEIRCSRCDAHLGHVFDDGPGPSGLRYCINSAAMDFVEESSPQGPSSGDQQP